MGSVIPAGLTIGLGVDTIINQKDTDVICIYCAIGKQVAAVAKVVENLRKHEAMEYSTVIMATEEDPAAAAEALSPTSIYQPVNEI